MIAAFLATLAIEGLVLFLAARWLRLDWKRLCALSVIANAITHPAFVYGVLVPHQAHWWAAFIWGELAVFLVESLIYALFLRDRPWPARLRLGAGLGLAANSASALAGLIFPF